MSRKTMTIIIFLLILSVGTCIRFLALGKDSFWIDEYFSYEVSREETPDIINKIKNSTDLPLYHLLLHYWRGIFGETEGGLRSFSAFIGALTIVLLFLAGRSLMGDKVALIGSLVFALAPFHLYYSQEARAYALLAFTTMGCIYFTSKILDSRTYYDLGGLIIFEAAVLYTHYYGFFVIATLNIYIAFMVFVRQEDVGILKSWILVQIAALILYAPWIPVFIYRMKVGGANPYGTLYASVYELKSTLVAFFLKGFSWYNQFNEFVLILIVLGIFFGIFNLKITKRKYILTVDKNKKHLFLIALFLIPMLLVLSTGQFLNIYNQRSLIIVLGPLCILLGLGICQLRARGQIITLVFYILLAGLSNYNLLQHPQKEQWREAATYIEDNAQSGDVAVVVADFMKRELDHYSKGQIATIGINRFLSENELKPIIDQILADYERIWLVKSHAHKSPIKEFLIDEYDQTILQENKKLVGIDIYLVKTLKLK